MSQPSEIDEVTVSIAGLRIRIARDGQSEEAVESGSGLSSFTVVRSPTSGALAAPTTGARSSQVEELSELGATDSTLVEAPVSHPYGSAPWQEALLAAVTPQELESLDLSGARHLFSRLRSSPGGWTPAARIGRALTCGLLAKYHLGFQAFRLQWVD